MFSVLQDSAETLIRLIRRGGKIYHLAVAYLLRNIPAKIIKIQRRMFELQLKAWVGDLFMRHSVYQNYVINTDVFLAFILCV